MEKILYFDYCAVILMFAMLFALIYRRLAYGTGNKTFVAVIICMILTTFFDIGMETLPRLKPISDNRLFWAHFFSYGYFLLRNASNLFYIVFILVIIKPVLKLNKYLRVPLVYAPYIIIAAVILSNLFTGKVFTITATEGYSRGPVLNAIYVLSLCYSLIGAGYLMTSYRYIERDRWIILLLQYPLTFISILIQFLHPEWLVEMISMGISLLLVLVLVVKPEDTMDPKIGILNYKSFLDEMHKYSHSKDSVSIVLIRLTNSYQVRSYLGEKKFKSYITRIARQIDSRFAYYGQKRNIYFDQSGCFFITVGSDSFDIEGAVSKEIETFKAQMQDLSEFGLRFEEKICTLRFPKDIPDVNSLLHFAAVFPEIMSPGVIYRPASELVTTKDFKIRNSMNKILDRAIKNRQLEMYYQPIYSIKEKSFVSAEALIRLKDPEFGFVPPGLFIPAAEQGSFIFPIGDFILQDVFRFVSENNFKDLGLKYIEVNLSVSQCIQRNFSRKIFSLQKSFNIRPSEINFEITESAYDNSSDIMAENIRKISEAGFSISLDDYGTGYSNMQRILDIPLSIVKIDKSLVDTINTKKGRTVIKNTISMMHDIDMHLVVEGIETENVLNTLDGMGADYIQGFYFSKPLPEKEFLEFLKKNNRRPASD